MSDAFKIAEQRFAGGEISEEEFDHIKEKISGQGTESSSQARNSSALRPLGKILLLVGGVIFAALSFMMIDIYSKGAEMAPLGRGVWFFSGVAAAIGLYLATRKHG
ncbi:SHOCT domain-containing protein [Cohaesibacter gelatinilyticus]|uniref:Short C-terminal domain-containing protein n=1 Tax=Cohaesibacter gelatinilyticus TaxID=372072 RepID=A0A285PJ78_9HYPH|nr:SHOCT domain-containing protein [Cohaesibacter gelatinilyticus]SNZ21327.1 hypothetical protein SAMN06265368_4444 [Cohaesibacter gelatinilyticus]